MANEGLVAQTTPGAWQDGTSPQMRMNRRGELVIPDYFLEMALEGRLFQINNAAIETADAIGTTSFATNGTNPAIYVGVPSGTTIIPLELRMMQGGSVANDAFTVVIAFEDAALYASSGTAKTPSPLRTDNARTSALTAVYTLPTITAPSDDKLIHAGIYTQMVADPVHSDQDVIWSARWSVAPVIVGASCLLVYAYTATTAPSFFWRLVWAEYPTVHMT